MKIFFDTNVYVSEALLGAGATRSIDATVSAGWRIYLSSYVLVELERVLVDYLNFPRRLSFLSRQRIIRRSVSIEPPSSRHVVPADPKDGPILQAALAGGVDYLVTNDQHLLALDPYEGLRIVSLSGFQELLIAEGHLSPPSP